MENVKQKQRKMIEKVDLKDITSNEFNRIVFIDVRGGEGRGLGFLTKEETEQLLDNPSLNREDRDWLWEHWNSLTIETLIPYCLKSKND